jgi:anti-sigma regulatory factor (Ser/Thr protein kinase)
VGGDEGGNAESAVDVTAPSAMTLVNASAPFVHEALVYRDSDEYLRGTVPFVLDGLRAAEPVLVAVPEPNLDLLRDAIGDAGRAVEFADMTLAGRNPGRIIPWVLYPFRQEHPVGRVRIVGEAVWPGRTAEEYRACVTHEALVNVAFAGDRLTILCPYDAAGLDDSALADAESTHPTVVHGDERKPSSRYAEPTAVVAAFNRPFPEPLRPVPEVAFDAAALSGVRDFVASQARQAGLGRDRANDLQLAVNEVATNTVNHAGGAGMLRIWPERGSVVAEVRDHGRFTDPMAGRIPPAPDSERGRGLLLVNYLCDLVQFHRTEAGTVIRLSIRLG